MSHNVELAQIVPYHCKPDLPSPDQNPLLKTNRTISNECHQTSKKLQQKCKKNRLQVNLKLVWYFHPELKVQNSHFYRKIFFGQCAEGIHKGLLYTKCIVFQQLVGRTKGNVMASYRIIIMISQVLFIIYTFSYQTLEKILSTSCQFEILPQKQFLLIPPCRKLARRTN